MANSGDRQAGSSDRNQSRTSGGGRGYSKSGTSGGSGSSRGFSSRPERGGRGRDGDKRPSSGARSSDPRGRGRSGSADSQSTSSRPSQAGGSRPPAAPEFRDGLGDIDVSILGPEVRRDLEMLSAPTQAQVLRWLAASRYAMEDDPEQAYAFATEAGKLGGRSSVVRETVGLAAYYAGDFAVARKELQAAKRISGRTDMVAVLADCERALGNPRKALEITESDEARVLRGEAQAEVLLVAAGARLDMDQPQAAVSVLRAAAANTPAKASWAARIYYGLADALLVNGDEKQAHEWFEKAATADVECETDALDRLAEFESSS